MYSLILQGPIYPFTADIINYYNTSCPFINDIIVSCWNTCNLNSIKGLNCKIIINNINNIPITGNGNVNYQIRNSFAGISFSQNLYAFKLRTDQQILATDLSNIINYFEKYKTLKVNPIDNSIKALGKIVCASIFTQYPYHPRDHIFFGYKNDLKNLFNIPLSIQPNLVPNFNVGIRAESYIGTNYCAKFNTTIKKHLEDPLNYLTDNSKYINESLTLSKDFIQEVFLVTPKIKHIWKKYGILNFKDLDSSPYFTEVFGNDW